MDFTAIIEQIFMFSIGGITVLGVVAFILKKVVENFINNIFKIKFEEFKKDNERLNVEHSIRYTRLHQDRADIIKSIYTSIVQIEELLEKYSFELTWKYPRIDKLNYFQNELDENLTCFKECINKNKIYFTGEINTNLNSIYNYFLGITTAYGHMNRDDASISKEAIEIMNEDKENLESTKEYLESEFQKLLGIL